MYRRWIVLTCVMGVLAAGCEDGGSAGGADGSTPNGNELSCNWNSEPLVPSSPPQEPTGQEGVLSEVLVGSWQHTYTILSNDSIEANGADTDIRYVFGPENLLFCQHVVGIYGPDSNEAPYTLEGNVIDVGTTYTALTWTQDVLILNNDAMGDQQYILQRRN